MSLPSVGYQRGMPRLVRSVSQSRAGNRAISTVEFADPFWQVEMETAPLYWPDKMILRAFEAEYGNSMRSLVYTVPAGIAVPQAYWDTPSDPVPADDGVLVSVSNGFTVAINSVTNGLDLRRGDLFSFTQSGFRSMHMVKVGAVASGNSISLSVEPAVPGYIGPGAVAKFVNPELNVRLQTGSMQINDDFVSPVSFTLFEVPK